MKFFYREENVPSELIEGLNLLEEEYPIRRGKGKGIELTFKKIKVNGNFVTVRGKRAIIKYGRVVDGFRAIGRLMGEMLEGYKDVEFQEKRNFEMLGVMIDASRNGVMRIGHLKMWLKKMALMGFNALTLYTEDTYNIEDEPFFGYLRGKYTYEELKELDNYAAKFGIEVFPCIQTLAHLEQILKWDAYKEIKDTQDILLAGEKKTYKFIEKMISSITKPFRSNRIHIGMDEAHGLGSGRYREKYGERRKFDIMNEHLSKVIKICKKYGLKPMIWSDMYFRIGSKKGNYYDKDSIIPQSVKEKIPKEVSLVYWDYDHTDYNFYIEWIERHKDLGFTPIVAPGTWTWNRFWALIPKAFSTVEPCLKACKDKGIKNVLLTLWGNDGTECIYDSALPVLQFCAEHNYSIEVNGNLLRKNFKAICKNDFDAFKKASEIDNPSGLVNEKENTGNVSKWLLWDDPLLGMWRKQLGNLALDKYYSNLSKELFNLAKKSKLVSFPAQIARVLSIKYNLREKIVRAYKGKKYLELEKHCDNITTLEKEVRKLWKLHRDLWFSTYKPFGWEVLDVRYGGLITRLDTLKERVRKFIKGEIDSIPEFETELFPIYSKDKKQLPSLSYREIVTPSVIS